MTAHTIPSGEKSSYPDKDELLSISLGLEGESALTILQWAATTFSPRLTFATGFGAEGCVLIDLIGRNQLPIDIFTLDTGLYFRETYMLWSQLEEIYDIKIRGARSKLTLEEQAAEHGEALWEREPDTCCHLRKVVPLNQGLEGFDAWLSAIRREQSPTRANAPIVSWDESFSLFKINPLVNWSKKDIWDYIREHDIPFNPLHLHGYPSIGCLPCTSRVADGEDERAGRWRGSNKTECGIHMAPSRPISLPSHRAKRGDG